MTNANLEEIWKELEALPLEQKRELRERLDIALSLVPTEEEFEQRLFEEGVISRLSRPIADLSSYEDFKPIENKGKPLSEVITEERR